MRMCSKPEPRHELNFRSLTLHRPRTMSQMQDQSENAVYGNNSYLFCKLREFPLIESIRAHEPGKCSRYSDWLRDGQQRGRSSSPGGVKNSLFSTSSRPALGSTQPLANGYRGIKRPGREDYHSSTSAEIKKMWIYISTSPYAFMV
jgi:hypothetical protein